MSIDLGLLAQYMVVALAVLASVGVVMRKQFPEATRRLRIAIALPLLRATSPAWLRTLGRWLAPAPKTGGRDCGGCNSCD